MIKFNKKIMTIVAIRPDAIRLSEVIKKLDQNFNHVLVHTGQHYDKILSDVFFEELGLREPDYNLQVGAEGREHFQQTAKLFEKIIPLARKVKPDLIIFLGDSNSVLAVVPLRKEGFTIAHIEAGMRSGDKRMLEEINRITCDHASNYHFVYHENNKINLLREGLPHQNIFVVGNTIVEPVVFKIEDMSREMRLRPSHEPYFLVDIHRPENFRNKQRMDMIFEFIESRETLLNAKPKMLNFPRTTHAIKDYDLRYQIQEEDMIDLVNFGDHLILQMDALFVLSDSGTDMEQPSLFDKPVIVPRSYHERQESVDNGCSFILKRGVEYMAIDWLRHKINDTRYINSDWLYPPNYKTDKRGTSERIIDKIKEII